MKDIRFLFTLVAICICVISCGPKPQRLVPNTRDQLQREFVDIMLDSTTTWKRVTDVVYPFVDSLCVAAADETSLENRMYGQEWGYVTIECDRQ